MEKRWKKEKKCTQVCNDDDRGARASKFVSFRQSFLSGLFVIPMRIFTHFWNRSEPQMEKHPSLYKIDQQPDFSHRSDSVPADSLDSKCMARIVCRHRTLNDRQQSMSWPPRNTLPNIRTSEHMLDPRCTLIRKLILLPNRFRFHPNQLTVCSLPHRLIYDLRYKKKSRFLISNIKIRKKSFCH